MKAISPKWLAMAAAPLFLSTIAQAHLIVDHDGNGLIDINSVQDLYDMRHDPYGTSLNGDASGCPNTGCFGYELMHDLDFDSNQDGMANEGDAFWNDGLGWEPIPQLSTRFHGNGHTIKNLYINSDSQKAAFAIYASNARFRNITFDNAFVSTENSSIKLENTAAILATDAYNAQFYDLHFNNSQVYSRQVAGGMVAEISGGKSTIEKVSATSMQIQSEWIAGGVTAKIAGTETPQTQHIPVTSVLFQGSVVAKNTSGLLFASAEFIQASNIRTFGHTQATYAGGLIGTIGYSTVEKALSNNSTQGVNAAGAFSAMKESKVKQIAITTQVTGSLPSAGFVATMEDSYIEDSYAKGSISSSSFDVAGFVGRPQNSNSINRVYSAMELSPGSSGKAHAFSGPDDNEQNQLTVTDSYWNRSLIPDYAAPQKYAEGATSSELTCPMQPADLSCDRLMYENWLGNTWTFGSRVDLPELR